MAYVQCLAVLICLGILVTVIVVPIILTRSSEEAEIFLDESVKVPIMEYRAISTFEIHNQTKSSRHTYIDVEKLLERIKEGSKITFLTHGYCPRTLKWSEYLTVKNLLFNVDKKFRPDCVIMVDWRGYCDGTSPYVSSYGLGDWLEPILGFKQANQNSKRIANEVSHVIYNIVLRKRVNPSNIHLIGFSLGAPMMAIAAWRLPKFYGFYKKIGRITGIDPAYPKGFSDPTLCMSLDATDGEFVDIIHTDTRRFGQPQARGHLDFYVNGGYLQPGCGGWTELGEDICSHDRSFDLFTASLEDTCHFDGSHKCIPKISEPGMEDCPSGVRMGFYAIETPRARGNYYIDTTSSYPFCLDKKSK